MADPESTDFADNVVAEPEVHIRAVKTTDLEELAQLDGQVFGDLEYPRFVLHQLFDVHLDCWQVAERPNGLLVGYSFAVPTTDGAVGWLLGLGVRKEYRRQGFGRRLTLVSMDTLRSFGVGQLRLTVDPGNFGAFDLYRKLGFVAQELVRDRLGPGEHRLVMSRNL